MLSSADNVNIKIMLHLQTLIKSNFVDLIKHFIGTSPGQKAIAGFISQSFQNWTKVDEMITGKIFVVDRVADQYYCQKNIA